MEKNVFLKFANLVGFKINEEALEVVTNEYDEDYPDNWDEMSDDEKTAWKEKHMVKPNASKTAEPKVAKKEPEPEPAPVANAQDSELAQLVAEFGGVKGIRSLLANAQTIVESTRQAESTERANLIAEMVLNSSETLKEEDLEDIETSLLRKMAEAMRPTGFQRGVDYSLLGVRQNKQEGAKEKVAPRPVHFARKPASQEANDG